MNIKGNPLEPYEGNNYKRDAIWDYEEKKDNEKKRWKELYNKNKAQFQQARREYVLNNPGYAMERVAEMHAKRPPDLLENIARRKKELADLVHECGCEFPINIPWDKQDKAIKYFKKLKEARDRIKAEREKSL